MPPTLDADVFYTLARRRFDAPLVERLGFSFERVGYARVLTNGLRQSLAFDRTGDTFHVQLGLNAAVVSDDLPADESGASFIQYLTKVGVSDFPRRWPCHNEKTALRSFERIAELLPEHLYPWLSDHATLGDFARLLGEKFPLAQARLFLIEGNLDAVHRIVAEQRRLALAEPPSPTARRALAQIALLLEQDSV
jgi:hypothetical protein